MTEPATAAKLEIEAGDFKSDLAAAYAIAAAIWGTAPDCPYPWDEMSTEDQAACAAVAAQLVPAFEKVTDALKMIARTCGIYAGDRMGRAAYCVRSPGHDGRHRHAG